MTDMLIENQILHIFPCMASFVTLLFKTILHFLKCESGISNAYSVTELKAYLVITFTINDHLLSIFKNNVRGLTNKIS